MSTTTRKTTARKAATTKTTPKASAAKKSTTRKAAPKAKAPAKKAAPKPAEPKVRKSDLPEDQRDWTYLAEKEPTDLHYDMAAWIQEVTGIEMDVKSVQAVAVLRMVYQRSDRNKARSTYRPLDETVVAQRSTHMIQAHQDAKRLREEQEAEVAKKQAVAKQRRTAKKAASKKA